jgi:glycosyltransferase involved in cell wall biosynthesis
MLHLTPLAEIGGCEVNCLRIIQARGDCDHSVLVFGDRGPMSAAWERVGARVEHLGAWGSGTIRFGAALAAWKEKAAAPDAIAYWSTSRLPAILKALGEWKVQWAVYLGNPITAGLVGRIRRALQELLNPVSRTVTLIACSQHVAASHRRAMYFRRFATRVIYNAVDPVLDRPHHYRELPPGSGPRVGMVARLDPIKDHKTVIGALAAIAGTRPDIVVEFAGDGPLHQELQREARRLAVGDRVRFLGSRPVGQLLPTWDIYLHSTTESEGMGTAVAEAMMAGVPCLVSDLAVMREVCGQEGAEFAMAGSADRLADALVRLVLDQPQRRALGSAAQSRARRMFGMSQTASEYVEVLFSGPIREPL